ncbi:ABC transporter permease [Clostridium sp. JS66]|uniref:ABC transporter permease n=1 Tax=Clostridium sp. JS66 TaxID=3064705 RepID=UPI00298DBC61|nr:ABC transporter permease [Clostridium sp. JS66]WPC42205.1 ABC transporter permease [Clostridium sp. JS66]
MYRLIKCELLKLKRQRAFIISIIITLIPIILGLFTFKANYSVFKEQNVNDWLKGWGQVAMFYSPIIFPIIASIYCAMIFRVEYMNKNMKIILSTPVSRKSLYISKFITAILMVLFLQIVFGITYFMVGKLYGITDPFPIRRIINILFFGWIGALPLISVQMYLSLKYEEFTKSIMIASCFSLLGFFISAVKGLKYIWPWAIQKVSMDISVAAGIQGIVPQLSFTIYCLIFMVIINVIGIRKFDDGEFV